MEDSRNVAGWTGGQEVLTGDILGVEQVESIIDAITAEELSQLAQELIVDSQLRLAVVGPLAKSEPLEELLKLSLNKIAAVPQDSGHLNALDTGARLIHTLHTTTRWHCWSFLLLWYIGNQRLRN